MTAITQGAHNLQQQGTDSVQPLSQTLRVLIHLKNVGNLLDFVDGT